MAVPVVTGAYQAWRGIGSWQELTSTSYGRLVVVKLAAVVLLLSIANLSRQWTARWAPATERPAEAVETREPQPVGARRIDAGEADSVETRRAPAKPSGGPECGAVGDLAHDQADCRRGFRRTVLGEVAVAVVVMAMTTVLTSTQPSRAAAESGASASLQLGAAATVPFDMGPQGGREKVEIEMTPGRTGVNQVTAVVFGANGAAGIVPEVRLTFTLPARNLGPIDAKLTDQGGYWGTDTLRLPLPGTWTMRLTVRTTDIDEVTVSKTIKIG
ncbi:CopD family protein [Streptomyces sp. NPDC003233]